MPVPWVLAPAHLGAISGIFTLAMRMRGSRDATNAMTHMVGLQGESITEDETKKIVDRSGSPKERSARISQAWRNQIFVVLGELARDHLVPNLVAQTPVWRGNLAHSTQYVLGTELVRSDEEVVRLIIYQNAHRNRYFYRQVMEEGRTPHSAMPPVQNIEDWARSKVTGRTLSDPKQLRRTAFMIAKSIARKGIAGRNYTTLSIMQSQQAIQNASASLGQAITVIESGPAVPTAGVEPLNVVQVYERSAGGRFAPRQPIHRRGS